MQGNEPLYPTYSRPERIADGVIHAIGVTFAVAGAITLIVLAAIWAGGAQVAAISVYGGALIATFAASALYHMSPRPEWRPTLRRIDHAAIYLKIAGTYTPFVVLIGSAFAYGVLALVWVLALGGALAKVFFWRNPGRFGTVLYLVLGWLAVLLVWPMAQTLPPVAAMLAVAGGFLYTAGVIFFTWESLRFSNAIWHGFVLAASGCFFAAITLATVLPAA